jgi:Holliday junction DNA helicase RuvB
MPTQMGYAAYRLSQEEPENRRFGGHSKVTVKRGDDITHGPYPKHFTDFIGQEKARLQIIAAISSAIERGEPMDHMLLASSFPGIGKTALSRLTARLLDVGFVELGGKVRDADAAAAIREMQDGDVLFLDELHRLVQGGKAGAEWLLTLLHDGELHTPQGVVVAPRITVIAATTDAQRLPETILDRFILKPILDTYTKAEAVQIARLHADRLGFGDVLPMPESNVWLERVATASDNNPRRIGNLLSTVRDSAITARKEGIEGYLTEEGYDITEALDWSGLTEDGLTMGMQEYLGALFLNGGKAGIGTIKASINEEVVTHTEKALIQRGYVVVTGSGRSLTDYGMERAEEVANDLLNAHLAREKG